MIRRMLDRLICSRTDQANRISFHLNLSWRFTQRFMPRPLRHELSILLPQ